jgi:hypothetical protein
MIAPPLRTVTLDAQIIYYVHGDKSRPVSAEMLSCGHPSGDFRERSQERPFRRRCRKCLKMRVVSR